MIDVTSNHIPLELISYTSSIICTYIKIIVLPKEYSDDNVIDKPVVISYILVYSNVPIESSTK